MMNKWITCEELCSRWKINKYTLAQIVEDGKLQSFSNDDFSAFYFLDGGSYKASPDGQTMSLLRNEPFTVDEVTKLIFLISDVEEYEKKNEMFSQSKDSRGKTITKMTATEIDKNNAKKIAAQYIRDCKNKKNTPYIY